MRVAVVARVAEQGAAAAQQGEIDAPGIDAERVDAAEARRRTSAGSVSISLVEVQHVPVQRIERADRPLGKR